MKRALLTILLFLLLGAVANVAVAWGYALWSPSTPGSPIGSNPRAGRECLVVAWSRLGVRKALIAPGPNHERTIEAVCGVQRAAGGMWPWKPI